MVYGSVKVTAERQRSGVRAMERVRVAPALQIQIAWPGPKRSLAPDRIPTSPLIVPVNRIYGHRTRHLHGVLGLAVI
jgi:hypothetical protein